jgi:hypothetical protein
LKEVWEAGSVITYTIISPTYNNCIMQGKGVQHSQFTTWIPYIPLQAEVAVEIMPKKRFIIIIFSIIL